MIRAHCCGDYGTTLVNTVYCGDNGGHDVPLFVPMIKARCWDDDGAVLVITVYRFDNRLILS